MSTQLERDVVADRPEREPVAPAGEDYGLLDQIETGIAVLDPTDWSLLYENAQFSRWFPAPAGPNAMSLSARMPAFDVERARQRLARGRPYRVECEVRPGPRAIPLQVDVRGERLGDTELCVIEARTITKQKEAEYMLDSYSRLMERQARALEQEKERVERLLLNIMPRRIADELRDVGTTTPQLFESASVLLLDFVGFTQLAISRDPTPLIAELNDVFTSFDRIVEHHRGERIKTIGDAYMAVTGLPEPDPDHELNVARLALRMRRFLERRNGSAANRWRCRIGIGCGPVIGSIVGVQKYVYDIFGAPVNLAARLEALAEPMQILISAAHAERIRDEFVVRPAGSVDVKGFGRQQLFALEDEVRRGR